MYKIFLICNMHVLQYCRAFVIVTTNPHSFRGFESGVGAKDLSVECETPK